MALPSPCSPSEYDKGCECVDCSNYEVLLLSIGGSVTPNRLHGKAAKRAAKTFINGFVGAAGGGGGGATGSGIVTPLLPPPPFWGYSANKDDWVFEPGDLAVTAPPKTEKLPPMNCKVCNHRNEYVGKEHLVNGVYVCRQCRPRGKQ